MEHVIVCNVCSSPTYFKNGTFYHDVLPRDVATIVRKVQCLALNCTITVKGNSICHSSSADPGFGQ